MRNRFFFIILASLIFAAVGINSIQAKFFENQRLKLIDKQISEASRDLLESPLFLESVNHPDTVEQTISNVLHGARIGKVFVLRDPQGGISYQSLNLKDLKVDMPVEPEWIAVQTEDEYVRVHNIPIPGASLMLQVGLVLDRNFLNWQIVDRRVINYVTVIVLSLFIVAVFVTLLLLAPLRQLIAHLNQATAVMANLKDVRPLPARLRKYTEGFWARSDEFSSLVNTVHKLIDRINLNHKLTRSWTFQMAHELKTPLSIIRADTQHNAASGTIPQPVAAGIIKEVDQMNEIISQFLDWAELESSQVQKDLHAMRIKAVVNSVVSRLEKIAPGRIRVNVGSDFTVFANPNHLEQLASNLVMNALKFSPKSSPVEVAVEGQCLIVRDSGPGIPKQVRERLGQPFNVGPNTNDEFTGSGLGLAWVLTVARLYQWEFDFVPRPAGTEARVRFPVEET